MARSRDVPSYQGSSTSPAGYLHHHSSRSELDPYDAINPQGIMLQPHSHTQQHTQPQTFVPKSDDDNEDDLDEGESHENDSERHMYATTSPGLSLSGRHPTQTGKLPSKTTRQTRKRSALNCTPCRRRKRKCDRQLPCSSCVKRGERDQCFYQSQQPKAPAQARYLRLLDSNAELKDRVLQLESLVREYASDTGHPPPDLLSGENGSAENLRSSAAAAYKAATLVGSRSRQNKIRYKGLTSWDMILKEIEDVKIAVDESFDTAYPDNWNDAGDELSQGDFLSTNITTHSVDECLTCLPDATRRDALLVRYFECYHTYYPYIEPSEFFPDYQNFCRQPSDPTMLGLVFSMLALAIANDDPTSTTADFYAEKALACLKLAGYTTHFDLRTVSVMLNVLFFYQRERLRLSATWVMLGSLVQIARALGLHRDPSHLGITGHRAQCRRILWTAVITMDTIHAARYGRVSIIDADEWDTLSPLDAVYGPELHGSLTSVPISILFTHAKFVISHRMQLVFRHLYRPRAQPSYRDVLEVEAQTRKDFGSLPSFPQDQTSDNTRWLYNLFGTFIEAHTMLVIHRPFLLQKTSDYHHSRIMCLDAARKMTNIVEGMYARREQGTNAAESLGLQMSQFDWHIREFATIGSLPAASVLCLGLWIRHHPRYDPLPPHLGEAARDEGEGEDEEDQDKWLIQTIMDRFQRRPHLQGIDLIRTLYRWVTGHGGDLKRQSSTTGRGPHEISSRTSRKQPPELSPNQLTPEQRFLSSYASESAMIGQPAPTAHQHMTTFAPLASTMSFDDSGLLNMPGYPPFAAWPASVGNGGGESGGNPANLVMSRDLGPSTTAHVHHLTLPVSTYRNHPPPHHIRPTSPQP
ncbi:hypothetical protein PYCC9005_000970 [Savitreella phatthalungensis]